MSQVENRQPRPVSSRAARGGVHPSPRKGALHGARSVAAPVQFPGAAGRFPGFSYNGGPVIRMPEVRTSFWGSLWQDSSHQQRATRLNQYHRDLLQSGFMNVLSQYGVGSGAGNAGQFIGATFLPQVPNTLNEQIIHQTIQAAINAGQLPEPGNPSNGALIIYLDENIGVDDQSDPQNRLVLCEPQSDDAFGYHSFFVTAAGNPFYYAVIPALGDGCLTATCPVDSQCSLHRAQTQEQRQTQVASHEFAEMTTDPQLNAWFDPDPNTGENGDICNGESDTIVVGSNTWTVQRTYSKQDDIQTDGGRFCLSQAPAPLPRLPNGPA